MEAIEERGISDLPEEVLLEIMGYLGTEDLKQAVGVCRRCDFRTKNF